jgi:hypothetical protein
MHVSHLSRSKLEYFAFKCSGTKVFEVGNCWESGKKAPTSGEMTSVFVLQVKFDPWLRPSQRTFLEGTKFHKTNVCWK